MSNLEMFFAESHFKMFGDADAYLRLHQEATDRRDCEAFLKAGIDSFRWLNSADQRYRSDLYKNRSAPNADVEEALGRMLTDWLRISELAEDWIASHLERGSVLEQLNEFRACRGEAHAMLHPSDEIAGQMATLRDLAIQSHQAGESSDCKRPSPPLIAGTF